jgi:hypothetical protein
MLRFYSIPYFIAFGLANALFVVVVGTIWHVLASDKVKQFISDDRTRDHRTPLERCKIDWIGVLELFAFIIAMGIVVALTKG